MLRSCSVRKRGVLGFGAERGRAGLHLRVKLAGRGLDNVGGAAVDLDLEDLAGGRVGDDGEELHEDVLGHHVEDELEGKLVLLAGGDRDIIPDSRQVAEDGGVGGRVLGKRLGGLEHATDKGNVNWVLLVVGDLNQRLGDTAVDELDAEDVGIGEGRLNVGLELGLLDRDRGDGLGVDLRRCALAIAIDSIMDRIVYALLDAQDASCSGRRKGGFVMTQLTSSWAKTVATRRASRAREDHLKLTIVPESKTGAGGLMKERKGEWLGVWKIPTRAWIRLQSGKTGVRVVRACQCGDYPKYFSIGALAFGE